MFRSLFFIAIAAASFSKGSATEITEAGAREIYLTLEDCLFVKTPVPERGIVCSNNDRSLRLSKKLKNAETHKCPWGPFIVIGEYQGERVFVACASVGTGSGLLFTELFAAGAKFIIRYGSDDIRRPPESDAYLVKIIDEADNLYGYNIQSGVDPEEWGKPVPASPRIVEVLIDTAQSRGISHELRICHHLENYHGLRSPDKFSSNRSRRLREILEQLNQNEKPSSYDMETAVLFRVAKDFGLHAATILQTINKEGHQQLTAEEEYRRMIDVENTIFFDFVFEVLLKI